jgi:hypothetical protein
MRESFLFWDISCIDDFIQLQQANGLVAEKKPTVVFVLGERLTRNLWL